MASETLPATEEGRQSMKTVISHMGNNELQKVGLEVVGEIIRRIFSNQPAGHQEEVFDAILSEIKLRGNDFKGV